MSGAEACGCQQTPPPAAIPRSSLRMTAPFAQGGLPSTQTPRTVGEITMGSKHNPRLLPFARKLRKDMTRQERHLWYDFLRNYPVRVLRQRILGRYIADFYCAQAKLVIELDGTQHYEEIGIEKDTERTAYLEQFGLQVLRIPNNQIDSNFPGVCEAIDHVIQASLV